MMNVYQYFLISAVFLSSPVSSGLPRLNGIPLAISPTIRIIITDNPGCNPAVVRISIKRALDHQILKNGMEELREYCKQLVKKDKRKFGSDCKEMEKIYETFNFQNIPDKYDLPADTEYLARYVNIVRKHRKKVNTESIKSMLTEEIYKAGWEELKEFCRNNDEWKEKEECQMIMSFMDTGPSSNGPEQNDSMSSRNRPNKCIIS